MSNTDQNDGHNQWKNTSKNENKNRITTTINSMIITTTGMPLHQGVPASGQKMISLSLSLSLSLSVSVVGYIQELGGCLNEYCQHQEHSQ